MVQAHGTSGVWIAGNDQQVEMMMNQIFIPREARDSR